MSNDKTDGHRRGLSIVSGTKNFENIADGLLRHVFSEIKQFGFLTDNKDGLPSPKMAFKLTEHIIDGVARYCENVSAQYITRRLNEQIERYIELGMPIASGYDSEERFREALAPLVLQAVEYFAPPADHPIQDGEFTLLLVLPIAWVPLRRQVAMFRSVFGQTNELSSALDEVLKKGLRFTTQFGKKSPQEPYIIVGINGGRGLKECTVSQADEEVTNYKQTYLSVHELIQLLLIRPYFLPSDSESLALGEKYDKRDYVKFTNAGVASEIDVVQVLSERFGVGIAKPYYTHMITVGKKE